MDLAASHWDHLAQGLTPAGAVIVAVIVTYVTAGTASGAGAALVESAAGAGAAATTAGVAATAAATAAMTTLASQAAKPLSMRSIQAEVNTPRRERRAKGTASA